MKKIVGIMLLTSAWLLPHAVAQQVTEVFRSLTPLAGTWQMKRGDLLLKEVWQWTNDSLMEGQSYKWQEETWQLMEDVRLVRSGAIIQYIPVVHDQNEGLPVPFSLITHEAGRFVFENKDHDFPQQISYHFIDDRHLQVAISGQAPNGVQVREFPYERINDAAD